MKSSRRTFIRARTPPPDESGWAERPSRLAYYSMTRLPPQTGEWIDRSRPIEFHFEGRAYSGFAGDTISSALCAHGLKMLGRSFKYHRPRGVFSLANHDVNVLVDDDRRTNVRADVTLVR